MVKKESTNGFVTKLKIEGFNYEYGVVNRSIDGSVYFEVGSWVSYSDRDIKSILAHAKRFKADFRQWIYFTTLELFGDRIDCNRTLRSYVESDSLILSKLVNKSSFFGIECVFFIDGFDYRKLDDKLKMETLGRLVIEFLIEQRELYFSGTKQK